jgi:hypothetical protein
LNIHAIVCSADMAGLQEQLEIKYEQLKRGVEEYRAQLPEGWVVPTFKLPSSISAEMSEDIARLSKSPAVAKLSTRSESTDMLDRCQLLPPRQPFLSRVRVRCCVSSID